MQPHSFSIVDMVSIAYPVVKAVMLILVLASVGCWSIMIEKTIRLFKLRRELDRLDQAATKHVPASSGLVRTLLSAAEREAEDGGARGEDRGSIRARLERAMRASFKSELERIEAGLPFLATVGSAAPFIGLFGTVWGIMNSFTAIAHQQDTSLATVAPGIAEALFATALGLVAAIPAVMAYNHFAVKLGRASTRGVASISEIARNLSKPHSDSAQLATVEPLRAGKSH